MEPFKVRTYDKYAGERSVATLAIPAYSKKIIDEVRSLFFLFLYHSSLCLSLSVLERQRPCAAALIAEAEVGMYVSECSFYTRPDALTPRTSPISFIHAFYFSTSCSSLSPSSSPCDI